MDKKIAIVTMWANPNYGSTLQAYALQKVIRKWGYESEFINFCPEKRSPSYRLSRLLKDVIILGCRPKVHLQRRRIRKFISSHFFVSPPYYTYKDLCDKADERYSAAICGSDQIWSNAGGYINPFYYLTFISKDKRISYAPSIGYNYVSDEILPKFIEYINDIRFLSIREKQGAEIIKQHTGRDAEVVLDPTLLLSKDEWEKEMKQTDNVSSLENYIFCYLLGKNQAPIQYACQLSQFTGYPIVGVETKFSHIKTREIKRIVAGPFDWLRLIRNASYVLTDSLHGTLFSIIFRKQFGVFKRFRDDDPICQNSRIYNILDITGLQSRLITYEAPPGTFFEERIDYDKVQLLLDLERHKSLMFLERAISAVHAS